LRRYDVSDGLANSQVVALHQDRKGYLWFGTWEGLSRFDGYRFTNYSVRDGLGHPVINHITEDRQGRLWAATNGGGVAPLIDDPSAEDSFASTSDARRRFINFRVSGTPESNQVNAILFDPADNLWCATDAGLYRAAKGSGRELQFQLIAPRRTTDFREAAFADRQGRLWFGVNERLIQIVQGRIISYGLEDGLGNHVITSVAEDQQGRILAVNTRAVFEFIAPSGENTDDQQRGRWRRLPITFQSGQLVGELCSTANGALWINTSLGLLKYQDGKQTLYNHAHGLSNSPILALAEDRDGNLWISAAARGVYKLASELIVSFTSFAGVPEQNVLGVIENNQGRIFAGVGSNGMVEITDGRVVPIAGGSRSWGSFLIPFAANRDWWLHAPISLARFAGSEWWWQPDAKLTIEKLNPTAIAKDPLGRLWIISDGQTLYHIELGPDNRGRPAVFAALTLPAELSHRVISMMSDQAGNIWLRGHTLLARFKDNQLDIFKPTAGLPEADPRAFFQDSRGWLWIGLRYKGVAVTENPNAAIPQFINYSTQNGLASDALWAIAEDDAGRIYLGTGKGLNQLDPLTGRIRHFNVRDGLAGDVINNCVKDRQGNIWIATTDGLSKFNPRAERFAEKPPPIYFSRVQVAGEDLPLPETGAANIPKLELTAGRNNLLVEFVALIFQGEQRLRYQYKLVGVDEDWSQPTEARSVNYARLAPGSYQPLPDVLPLDIQLPGMLGSEGVKSFREKFPALEIVMLTVLAEQEKVFESICNGACGYLLKETPPARLLEAIREARNGGAPMSPEIARKVVKLFQQTGPPEKFDEQLTPQEARRLKLLAEGYSYNRAATELKISVNTVRDYIRSIYDKLHVHSKSEAVSKALRNRLIY
jgi:ligand-binding sensor domain-containing protein/DNA-binding NarL/FixJ family response regulator